MNFKKDTMGGMKLEEMINAEAKTYLTARGNMPCYMGWKG
jgi:hypothetical protein